MLIRTGVTHHVSLAAALHGARRAADEREADGADHSVHRDGVALQRALLLPTLRSTHTSIQSYLTCDGSCYYCLCRHNPMP